MKRQIAAVLMALGLMLTAMPAEAATASRVDRYNASIPAQNLKKATFRYADNATYRVKIKNLSKRKTRLAVKFDRPGFSVIVDTKFIGGRKRVVAHKQINRAPYDRYRIGGVSAKWNFDSDVIRIVIPKRHVSGPRASFSAFTLYKGAMHGNYEGDGVYASVRRY